LSSSLPQGRARTVDRTTRGGDVAYEVRTTDGSIAPVEADAYRQEGQLVTFYRLDAGRRTIDCWAVPVASFRTSRVDQVVLVDPDGVLAAAS
jgi:hypothetical protein